MPRRGNSTMVGLSAPRVIVVPRWGATPDDDWYPWLKQEVASVDIVRVPDPRTDSIATWTQCVAEAIGRDPYALARTLVIGHSLGCRAMLHALANLPPGRAVNKVLCVAGWWTIDRPWPEIQPWLDAPLDFDAVRDGFQGMRVLISTNDPYTADHTANAEQWQEKFGAEVVLIPEAAHFNGQLQPIVLDETRTLFAAL